ncbi:MAG: AraC family transcriptional regulator [Hydrogenophaga sp.]|nr:AraC family transcriptional regulator [Hydrogenophaga sp.]MDO9479977.1 AraC family transcriptional regulator [Hydrogenophaga sp.]MDP3346179.1 AraC family transcriptional regulator [Hydrogenophaga sp.]MDP3806237.1 AraC family transcriptional regulator [Hydrogenophaga sp.]
MAFVQAIAQAYAQQGKSPAQALALAQIAPALLTDAGARITTAQMEAVSGAAMRELNDEALGWFARPLPWGSYGLLARASLSAPTLGLALKRWCRHHGLLTRDITLAVQLQGDDAAIVLTEHRPPGGDGSLREFCSVSVLRNVHGLACWFVDSRIPLRSASFCFNAPPHANAYGVLFDGPTRFTAEQTAIRFDARYLDLAVKRDETAMNQMLQRALPIQVRPYRRDRLLVQRVRQLLLTQPQDTRNADDLAALLHTSARSLHRQLQEEGATLQALKDEVRRERTMALLQRTSKPVKQVAEAAGFQNEKSFIRAFKGWTGMTPGEWRGKT